MDIPGRWLCFEAQQTLDGSQGWPSLDQPIGSRGGGHDGLGGQEKACPSLPQLGWGGAWSGHGIESARGRQHEVRAWPGRGFDSGSRLLHQTVRGLVGLVLRGGIQVVDYLRIFLLLCASGFVCRLTKEWNEFKFLPLSLCLSVSISLCLSLSLSLSLSLCLSLCISFLLYVSLSLISLSVCLSVSYSLSFCPSLILSLFLFLSLSHSHYLTLCRFLSALD
jgi:hypothetical protein